VYPFAARVGTVLLLWLAGAGAPAADSLHVIELHHRAAAEVVPLIRPLLHAGEGISASGYRLLLRASESRRREIERLVAGLDVAPRQLTVTLRRSHTRSERGSRASAGGEVGIGSRGRLVLPEDNEGGGIITDARGRDGLRLRSERRSSSVDGAHTQVLRVQDGSRAFIRIGRSVPAVQRVLALTGRDTQAAARGIDPQDFTTGFDVLPQVSGDSVRLEIIPRLTTANPGDDNFQFHELRTTVTARLGEWVDLGALLAHRTEVHRAILQAATAETGEHATFALKVE